MIGKAFDEDISRALDLSGFQGRDTTKLERVALLIYSNIIAD